MEAATKEQVEAEAERSRAELLHNPVSAVVTAGATKASLESAAESAAEAERAAAEAQSQAAKAYGQYQRFAEELAAAEAEFMSADDAARAAAATQQEQADAAAAAKDEAEGLVANASELDQAFLDQGLHAPAQGGITSAFGPRVHPVTGVHKTHTGTDFEGTDGQYYAAADGVVTYAGYDGAYGYTVHVDHGVVAGKHMETWYAHQPGLSVEVGQSVERGQVIGQVGSSGYSTGPHAHVELRLDGNPVDPMTYIR
jgi:murein DD-endopeptidase MepM/ murein hydrolase activator NlpD